MTRSKDPTEGACASCRKLIPLVPDDQGDLVVRTHHVVTSEHGYDVQECAGSRTTAADLDDTKDWAWVPEPAVALREDPVDPVPLSEALARVVPPMGTFGEAPENAASVTRDAFAFTPERGNGLCESWYGPHRCCMTGPHSAHRCGVPACRHAWPNEEAAHGSS